MKSFKICTLSQIIDYQGVQTKGDEISRYIARMGERRNVYKVSLVNLN